MKRHQQKTAVKSPNRSGVDDSVQSESLSSSSSESHDSGNESNQDGSPSRRRSSSRGSQSPSRKMMARVNQYFNEDDEDEFLNDFTYEELA